MSEKMCTFALVNTCGGVGFTLECPDPIKAAIIRANKQSSKMIDLHTTPCTYYERVNYSGEWHIRQGHTALNRHTNVWDGLFSLSDETRNNIIALRKGLRSGAITDKQKFKKDNIPGINGSCTCDTHHRDEKHIIDFNGLLFLDIDNVGDLEAIKRKVNALPYTVLSAESVSGGGLFAVFCVNNVSNGKDYRRAYCAAIEYLHDNGLSEHATVDKNTIDPVRFRYQTIDPNPYYNPNAVLWTSRIDEDTATPRRSKEGERMPQKKDTKTYDIAIFDEFAKSADWADFLKAKGVPKYLKETPYQEVAGDKRYTLKPDNAKKIIRQYRYKDGQAEIIKVTKGKRNATLYREALLIKTINPTLTFDEYFCACINEFVHFYDNRTEPMDAAEIIHILAEAWSADFHMKTSVKMARYHVTDEYAATVAKRNGESIKKTKQRLTPKIGAEIRHQDIIRYYDPTKTIAENLEDIASTTKWLKAYGFSGKKISRNTLIAALREQHIATYEERKESAILDAYIGGAESAKELQTCGIFFFDPKTARKHFALFEQGQKADIRSASFFYWSLNRVNRFAKKKGILSKAI